MSASSEKGKLSSIIHHVRKLAVLNDSVRLHGLIDAYKRIKWRDRLGRHLVVHRVAFSSLSLSNPIYNLKTEIWFLPVNDVEGAGDTDWKLCLSK